MFYSGFMRRNSPNIIDAVRVFDNRYAYLYKFIDKDVKLNSVERMVFVNGEGISDKRPICDNVKSLTSAREVKGISGGPVYYGKSVYGMLIGDSYILSEYIIEKLNKLNIH